MIIQKKKISDLKPSDYNPRDISEEALKGLETSLDRFGYVEPIIWNKQTGNVVGGHQRLKVLKKGKSKEVEVVVVDLNDIEEKALNVALNNQHISGEFNPEKLNILLEELRVDLPEFEELQLDKLEIEFDQEEDKEIEEDDAPEVQEIPVSCKGDLWLLGEHRLLCGDSTIATDVEKLMNKHVAILMITDPPYGVEYDPNWRNEAAEKGLISYAAGSVGKVQNDDRVDWSEAYRLFDCQVAYVWHADRHAKEVQESLEICNYKIISQIIWSKTHHSISRGDYHWQHEPCWYAVKKNSNHNWQGSRSETTLWKINREKMDTGHGTQKPVECMARPIKNNSRKLDIICDPFLGSGTTLIAAEQLNRKCYGMELDEKYCDVIIKRWEQFTGKQAKHENGKTFEELNTKRSKA